MNPRELHHSKHCKCGIITDVAKKSCLTINHVTTINSAMSILASRQITSNDPDKQANFHPRQPRSGIIEPEKCKVILTFKWHGMQCFKPSFVAFTPSDDPKPGVLYHYISNLEEKEKLSFDELSIWYSALFPGSSGLTFSGLRFCKNKRRLDFIFDRASDLARKKLENLGLQAEGEEFAFRTVKNVDSSLKKYNFSGC